MLEVSYFQIVDFRDRKDLQVNMIKFIFLLVWDIFEQREDQI